jgi:hypothetical protein
MNLWMPQSMWTSISLQPSFFSISENLHLKAIYFYTLSCLTYVCMCTTSAKLPMALRKGSMDFRLCSFIFFCTLANFCTRKVWR